MWETANCILKWLYRFASSSAMKESSFCPTSWPAFGVVSVLNFGHSNWHTVVHHCYFIFPQLYWNTVEILCVNLQGTKWWIDMCIYCEMITLIRLVDTSMISHNYLFWLFEGVRTFKIYSCSIFQIYHTVLLTIITMLYIRFLECVYLIIGSL